MTTDISKLISIALACGAISFAALAADGPPAKDAVDKDKKVLRNTVIVHANGEDEPEVFEFNSSDDGDATDRRALAYTMAYGKGGYLGVGLTDLTPDLRTHFGVPDDVGVMVAHVEPDSPAAKAGIKVGDIITGASGKKIGNSWSLTSVIRKMKDGDAATLEVWRDRKVLTINANVIVKERKQVDVGDVLMNFDGAPYQFKIDPEHLKEVTERMTKKFSAPEFQQRLQHQAELEKKMQELEKKMQELEKKLKDKSM